MADHFRKNQLGLAGSNKVKEHYWNEKKGN
jgi:hypothetical protein